MKPNSTIQHTSERIVRCEIGSLLRAKFHGETTILICTGIYPNTQGVRGIIIASPNNQDIGQEAEYASNGVEMFNGKITLEQIW